MIARFRATAGVAFNRTLVSTDDNARKLLACLHHIDPIILGIEVNYPMVGDDFHPFTPRNCTMNLDDIVSANETDLRVDTKDTNSRTLFVAPATDETPNDGVLQYTTVESIYDFKTIPDRSVVLLRGDQNDLLKCVADNRKLFSLELFTLTGLPGANYSATFDEATWAFNKVAYAPFISELRLAGEIAAQIEAQSQTPYSREKEAYTRKTGEVKQMVAYDVAPIGNESDEGDVEDMEL